MDIQQLDGLKNASIAKIQAVNGVKELDDVRVALLGKSGEITGLLKQLGTMPAESRKDFGQAVNQVKVAVSDVLEARKIELENVELEAKMAEDSVDVTLPASPYTGGKMHPISFVVEEVENILAKLGFSTATGPEVEEDFYNFTALNIPENHPARQDHDTFYLKAKDEHGLRKLLRTQTSNVQIHAMKHMKPPFRMMSIGRVYRCDSDLTHTPQFHQVEVLALDKDLTFGHLKGVLQKFLADFFERDVQVRLRPSYFPFTEPGAEVDIECLFCGGSGCRVCSQTGWIEVLGSGMVHRHVLSAGGVDSTQWQGFAFGAGIERLAMLKYGINDLRMFYESQAAFMRHFGKDVNTSKAGS